MEGATVIVPVKSSVTAHLPPHCFNYNSNLTLKVTLTTEM